jgi:hypothetical protein
MTKRDTSLPPDTAEATATAHNASVETHDFIPKHPGRPGWPRDLFHQRYREAVEATEPPHTIERLAANFHRLDGSLGIEPDSLRRLKRQHRT